MGESRTVLVFSESARGRVEAAVVTERLANRFPHLPRARVMELVFEVHHRFDNSRVREFVLILVEREARRALALAHTTPGLPE